jgi:hypothetical protein
MIQYVQNPTPAAREISIVSDKGVKSSVFVQPSARVRLPEGFSVCPDFKTRNPKIVVLTKE